MNNKSNSLLIVGAGSFSTEVDELAYLCGYSKRVFLDDANTSISAPIIGTLNDLIRTRNDYSDAIAAFGNNEMRMKYHSLLKRFGYSIPTLIHPTSYVSPDASIKCGSIIRAKAVVSRFVEIGEACIVNVGALIDHHCIIEDGCHILMGAVVRNKKRVPQKSWIKSNDVFE